MLGTLFRATLTTLLLGTAAIWVTSGLENRAWWTDPLIPTAASVLLGVVVILKRQGARAIPIAAAFIVLTSAFLVWMVFLIGPIEL